MSKAAMTVALEALELLVEERSSEAMDEGYKAIKSLKKAIADKKQTRALELSLDALMTCEVAYPGTRFKSKYFDEDKVPKAIKAIEEALVYDMNTGRMVETVMEEL